VGGVLERIPANSEHSSSFPLLRASAICRSNIAFFGAGQSDSWQSAVVVAKYNPLSLMVWTHVFTRAWLETTSSQAFSFGASRTQTLLEPVTLLAFLHHG